MSAKMLDDLNTILLHVTNLKQQLQACHSMAPGSEPGPARQPEGMIREVVINLHQLLSFSYADYHTIWSFWNRVESGYYTGRPFSPDALNRWRESLLVWRNEMLALRDLQSRYEKGRDETGAAPDQRIDLKEMADMAKQLEVVVLEMLGPVVNAQLSSLEAGRGIR